MINLKSILPLCMVALMWTGTVASRVLADTQVQRPPQPLQELTLEMLANNEELAALRRNLAALKEEVQAAGAWEDPRLGFGILNLPADSLRFDEQPMTQKQITLAQRLPWFGKMDLKTQRAALKAARVASQLDARRLALVRDLADAYYELGFVAASQEINARLNDHLDQIVRVAESRYASGKGLQQDVLQSQVEQSRLMEQDHLLLQRYRVLEDRINGLLNRAAHAPIVAPSPAGLPYLDTVGPRWQDMALAHNPEVHTRRVEIDQARVDVDLSLKAYYPDPDIRLAYGQRDADTDGDDRADFLSATIVFPLPVWAKRKQGRLAEAAANRHQAAKSRYQDLIRRLPHRVDALAAELNQARQNYELYQEAILIQAGLWAESARFSYEVGKVNFNTMVSAQLQELRLQRQAKQYLFEYFRKLAALDQLLGGRLSTPSEEDKRADFQMRPPLRTDLQIKEHRQ